MLTPKQITSLASNKGMPNKDSTAIENFLSTLGELTYDEAVANLYRDSRLYGWSKETTAIIDMGLVLHFEGNNVKELLPLLRFFDKDTP